MLRTLGSTVLLAGHLVQAQAFDPTSIAPTANASATDTAPPAEVMVRGTKKSQPEAGSDSLRAQDARGVAGTFGEPLQAVESLPGVAPMVSGLPFFYVRGAPPADTGYFVDGVPLPALFHLGPGPSVLPPPLLDRVDFFSSTAPARYGRFMGGIIASETKAPSPVARGEASIRLFDASAFVESPLDASSTALVAGRYGYPNLLLSLFAPNLSLEYRDYTVRLTKGVGDDDSVSVFAIGSYDKEQDTSQNLIPFASQFHRVDLRYDHRWSDGSMRIATTFGYDSTVDSSSTQTFHALTGRLRFEVEQNLGDEAHLSVGADANGVRNTNEYGGLPGSAPYLEQIGGTYGDLKLRPSPRIEITAGARFDAYRLFEKTTTSFDPRLAVRVGATQDVTWISTFGIAHQQPTYLLPVPALQVPGQELQKTYQLAEGVELRLPGDVKARVTGFYDVHRHMSDFVSDCGTFAQSCTIIADVDGRTYGGEVLIERPLGRRFGGWISYTLSRAEQSIGTASYLSPFDRTHVLSVVARYDFGSDIHAGVRGTYYTGRPDFPSYGTPGTQSTIAFGPGSQFQQHRLPAFYRIDARVDKRWRLGTTQWIAAVVEFFDLTLTKEALDFRCSMATGFCQAQEIGPIALPSIGVEGGF